MSGIANAIASTPDNFDDARGVGGRSGAAIRRALISSRRAEPARTSFQ
jgi:hypothetical protein